MSGHWQPPSKPWTSADAYVVAGRGGGGFSRGQVIGALIGAVVVGVGAGAVLSFREAPRAAASATPAVPQKVETIVPEVAADPADAEWALRSEGQGSTSTAPPSGVRASFSYCKRGGGTNCVVDGDTFYLNGAKVRIAGIDAPETHDYGCQSELELGNQATEMLHSFLNSGAVTMTGIDRDRDVYGRLLRNVSVNGEDVGEAMISAGVARAYAGGRRSWCG
jgi:endonuclease YncB( thermonuclease family)